MPSHDADVTTPQEEASQIFSEVLRDLTSPNPDIKLVLRRCQHACQVLNWQAEMTLPPRTSPVPMLVHTGSGAEKGGICHGPEASHSGADHQPA